ncbi:TraE/TraK family type IV conjugative transfer system protein [uncultured Lamprocystis sp.]|uniref:TraE/TraK family type IV conjugative transfer system protein n=1 Tax=uncultured Lamprocystis sp. TaxID=543132 RepID=UPI0025CFD7B0|nr:TraE/TraK family type IV conjugative transfer system protein [uncultured Lamprocystis sp.]
MTLNTFLATWDGVRAENRFNRALIVLLALLSIGLAMSLTLVERTVVLVPPALEHAVTIARDAASREAHEAWALYVAELIGNVTPSNADFLLSALDPLLAADLRQDVMRVLQAQVAEIKREQVSMSFQPRELSHDPGNQNIYVTGKHVTMGPGAQPVSIERTYVLRIVFRNYRPRLTHLEVYPGAPRLSTQPVAAAPPGPTS